MKHPPVSLLNSIARDLHELQAAGLSHAEAEEQVMARLFGSGPARRHVVVAMDEPLKIERKTEDTDPF